MKKILLLLWLLPFHTLATTWAETTVTDPIKPDTTCVVYEPMSSGGYIYNWPSKYDMVFWPRTDYHGIWYCEDSGFIAFIGDFEGLSEPEKQRISEHLKNGPPQLDSRLVVLQHLESVYSLRDKSAVFHNQLLRVLAYSYEQLGSIVIANQYRADALAAIYTALDSNELEEAEHLEYLYLTVNYELQLGDSAKSEVQKRKLQNTILNVEDPDLLGFSEYLTTLLDDLPYMEPGGILAPTRKSDID